MVDRELYCLYDRVTGRHLPVMEAGSLGDVRRMLLRSFLSDSALDPRDYYLVKVSEVYIDRGTECEERLSCCPVYVRHSLYDVLACLGDYVDFVDPEQLESVRSAVDSAVNRMSLGREAKAGAYA